MNLKKDYPSQWMLWEAESLAESVKVLQALGMSTLVFDSAANVPEKGNFIEIMKKNVASLEAALT
jgi:zinc transport system substrate-binding protein